MKATQITLSYMQLADVLYSLQDYWMRMVNNPRPFYTDIATAALVKTFYDKLRKRHDNMLLHGRTSLLVKFNRLDAIYLCYALQKATATMGGNLLLRELGKYTLPHIQYETPTQSHSHS
ncbi:MAG: hypothetical protein O9302_03230 [Cyclobacteriaceae bacterium]|nr:hypothetical protein [Cytophagales bacterium]MCZ8327049.1 hypothetical protein [Cyclobacteriaceae bacterium]